MEKSRVIGLMRPSSQHASTAQSSPAPLKISEHAGSTTHGVQEPVSGSQQAPSAGSEQLQVSAPQVEFGPM